MPDFGVIKTVEWIVDLRPEGGDAGGHVVAVGAPEEIAANAESYTGQISAASAGASAQDEARGGGGVRRCYVASPSRVSTTLRWLEPVRL